MRIDEKYKRLIKCFFSVVMILLLTVTYHQFWVRYYNKIIFVSVLPQRYVDDGGNLRCYADLLYECVWRF